MSDPVTNVEIEDVLSSIRRLVSDGDKARTRDPAPVQPEETAAAPQELPPEAQEAQPEVSAKPEKFVLTPAFMVTDVDTVVEADEGGNDHPDIAWFEPETPEMDTGPDNAGAEHDDRHPEAEEAQPEIEAHPETDAPHEDQNDEAEGEHDAQNEAEALDVAEDLEEQKIEDRIDVVEAEPSNAGSPDRSELVATIAELEAAVGDDSDDFEPDGSETLSQTIEWPGAAVEALPERDVPDAVEVEDVPEAESGTAHASEDENATDITEASNDADEGIDEYGDDDLDGLLEAEGVVIDEAALREMVAEVVREELTGPMGERITRNVRKLVRREIYRILSSQDFD